MNQYIASGMGAQNGASLSHFFQDKLLTAFGTEIVLLHMRLLYIHSFAIFIQSEAHRRYPPFCNAGTYSLACL